MREMEVQLVDLYGNIVWRATASLEGELPLAGVIDGHVSDEGTTICPGTIRVRVVRQEIEP